MTSIAIADSHLVPEPGDGRAHAGPTLSRFPNGGSQVEKANGRVVIDIEAFRQGKAFETVLEQFGPLILRVARAYAFDVDDCDDLYQEICLRVYDRRASYSGSGSMGGWINAVAHRTSQNWRKKQLARRAVMERYSAEYEVSAASSDRGTDPLDQVIGNEVEARLGRALARLSTRQADAFLLTQVEGYGTREAAQLMGVRVATVRSNLRHARKKLREYMGSET